MLVRVMWLHAVGGSYVLWPDGLDHGPECRSDLKPEEFFGGSKT